MSATEPEHVVVNREHWSRSNAEYTDRSARGSWLQAEPSWGLWSIPDSDVNALPDVAGKDVIDLGCGTGYYCAWLKRAGARRVVGVDVTPAQLATARRVDGELGLGIEFIEANAEAVPLPDAQFDVVFSEYGASIWCDPALWIPEAARLLRPGGELVFLRNSTVATLCIPDEGGIQECLQYSQRDIYRIAWSTSDGQSGIEFQAPHGDLIRILRGAGFEILDLIELYAPEGAQDHPYYSEITADWARRWPAEEIWKARLR